MKDHALIYKLIGIWPSKRDLIKWIQLKWQPKGHIDLKMGVGGFFIVIFTSLEDKERFFLNGPYFYYNVGLFTRFWKEFYNLDREQFMVAPIWVEIFSLPVNFWDPKILEGIGNSIGRIVKVVDSNCRGRYTSYARICVYMNITEPPREFVELEYQDEVWQQSLDYEHIPFDAEDVMNMGTYVSLESNGFCGNKLPR